MSSPEELRIEPDGFTNPMTPEDLYLIARVIPDLERFEYPTVPPPQVEN